MQCQKNPTGSSGFRLSGIIANTGFAASGGSDREPPTAPSKFTVTKGRSPTLSASTPLQLAKAVEILRCTRSKWCQISEVRYGSGPFRRKHCNDHQDQWHGNQADQKAGVNAIIWNFVGNGSGHASTLQEEVPKRRPVLRPQTPGCALHGRPHRWCCLELQSSSGHTVPTALGGGSLLEFQLLMTLPRPEESVLKLSMSSPEQQNVIAERFCLRQQGREQDGGAPDSKPPESNPQGLELQRGRDH